MEIDLVNEELTFQDLMDGNTQIVNILGNRLNLKQIIKKIKTVC